MTGATRIGLAGLSATEAVARLREGAVSSEALVRACLDRVAAVDRSVRAWAHLDPEYALAQARARDAERAAGRATGPLHGLPIGVKDIIDTADMPTENGTPMQAGRQPAADAFVVSLLREAGAVVMGKTVTTELAVFAPGKTRNPHDPARTPGGSSSGSAAAVAAGMVPAAVGTQTNGSVIRPAAFCGVYGYKPTHGLISRRGVLAQSLPLDTVGVMGRSVGDLALLADALARFDEADTAMRPRARPQLSRTAEGAPPLPPLFAFAKTAMWDEGEDDMQAGFAELAEALGGQCDPIDLPRPFDDAVALHRTLLVADFAKNFQGFYERGRDRLSESLRAMIEEGQRVLAADYNRALDWIGVLNAGLDRVFDRYDAILTPAAPGQAPRGLETTGNPAFCTTWTLCGTPAVTLPLLQGADGMPVGVQLVGRRGDDGRLLRTAKWLDAWAEGLDEEAGDAARERAGGHA